MNNRFLHALQNQKSRLQENNPLIAGTLGITLAGQTYVEVPDRPSYVYVQVRSSQAEVIEAFNQTVSPVYGLPVFIQWQGNRYVIVERDTMRYSNWGDFSSYLPRHASTHEFNGSAGDVVFVSQQQFLPLMPMPSGSSGNTHIVINDYSLLATGGNFVYSPLQPTVDLTVWKPSSPTGAIMVLVSLDASNGSLHYDVNSGTVFGNWLTGSVDIMPLIPKVSDLGRFVPIVAVRLINTSSALTWDNMYDVRPLFGTTRGVATAGGGGGSAGVLGVLGMDEGILLGTGSYLNFVGAGVTATISGSIINVNVPGGGGGGSSTGALLLDTSNGPLVGPLVIYQKTPASANQYFDHSSLVSYMSGTPAAGGPPFFIPNFSAAGEFVNWSTGSSSYGVYIDDEQGGNSSLYIIDQGQFDKPTFQFDQYIGRGINPVGSRYLNPTVLWQRHGNGITPYVSPFLRINHTDNTTDFGPSYEAQIGGINYWDVFPNHTGQSLSVVYPFPGNDAPYFYDTKNILPTGTTVSIWNHNQAIINWLTPKGDFVVHQLRVREYAAPFGLDPVSGSMAQGVVNLVNGTATIRSTITSMSSRIYLTTQFGSGSHVGYTYVYSRMAGSGFTIRSSDLQDNSLVAWLMTEPS